jgi:hypothetical protein
MSLFDEYIADPPLHRPACSKLLESWQGKQERRAGFKRRRRWQRGETG